MAFYYPCKAYNNSNSHNSNASWTPLFRLLSDFDNYSRQGARKAAAPSHWRPKFDIRETEQTYELHADLPGVNKEDVQITFTEPQTILISGKTERSYASSAPVAEATEESTTTSDAASEQESRPRSPYQATVEDVAYDSEEAPQQSEKTDVSDGQSDAGAKTESDQNAPVDNAKYWLAERSIGEFSRSFQFPVRVEQDAVTANFQNGVLSIVVPKAKKHESRRIAIN